jgi:hypothetical protein
VKPPIFDQMVVKPKTPSGGDLHTSSNQLPQAFSLVVINYHIRCFFATLSRIQRKNPINLRYHGLSWRALLLFTLTYRKEPADAGNSFGDLEAAPPRVIIAARTALHSS